MKIRPALLGLTIVTSLTVAACGPDRTEESREYGTVDTATAVAPSAQPNAAAPSSQPRAARPAAPARRDSDDDAAERRADSIRDANERAEKDAERERERARDAALSLPAGTVITLRNDATVSSRHHEAGHRITATAVNDVLDGRNRVVIPAGTKFLGRVSRIESASGNNDTARLDIEFNAIEVNGDAIPIIAETQSFDAVARGRGVTAEQAGKVGAGAIIGGVAGRVIGGNTRGAVVGAVVGTAAGVAVANATRETDIVIDRGGTITLRLSNEFAPDRPIASTTTP